MYNVIFLTVFFLLFDKVHFNLEITVWKLPIF